jgi:steroid 5-alpha reductase family enzyme
VWLCGVALKNASAYDPYWSVAPLVIAVYWAAAKGPLALADALFLCALLVWGVRLTVNWARRWRGVGHEDWRYEMYKTRMPKLWFVINLFGINLMPTVLVYLAMVPVSIGMRPAVPANLMTAAGFAVCALAVAAELFADRQMDAYRGRPQPKSPYIAEGLWLLCRHPNYLGEILFWWGIWLMQQSLVPAAWTIAGPAAITVLFVFVSIPMMEKHVLESRPEYARYIREVPMLVPLLKKQIVGDKVAPQ